jgi:uncharacterized protein YdaU (DUF1376 family)
MAEYAALPLFTDAYLADTRHLTTLQHGAYLLMLMTAWRSSDCALPLDDVYLARICGMDKRTWAANKDTLLAFWKIGSDAKIRQGRLEDERNYVEQKRNKNSEAGKASALKRKNRDSTGVQPKLNENATPSPSPSPSFKDIPSNDGIVADKSASLFPIEESKPKKEKRVVGRRLPDDWDVSKELGEWAMKEEGMERAEVIREADRFIDYWKAETGKHAVKLDWDRAFKNWIRRRRDGWK